MKSVKVSTKDPKTIIVGSPQGIELFSMDLVPISMVSLDVQLDRCCRPLAEKTKYMFFDSESGILAAVMKRKQQAIWYLYEIEIETLFVLRKRPIATIENKKIRSGREIKNLYGYGHHWYITLKNGLYVLLLTKLLVDL